MCFRWKVIPHKQLAISWARSVFRSMETSRCGRGNRRFKRARCHYLSTMPIEKLEVDALVTGVSLIAILVWIGRSSHPTKTIICLSDKVPDGMVLPKRFWGCLPLAFWGSFASAVSFCLLPFCVL